MCCMINEPLVVSDGPQKRGSTQQRSSALSHQLTHACMRTHTALSNFPASPLIVLSLATNSNTGDALPRVFICFLILLACCYRLLHAQDMLLATHDCGSYSSACTPSCGARRLSSSFLLGDSITLSFCPFRPACSQAILLIYACFPASIESPFLSPPLPYLLYPSST